MIIKTMQLGPMQTNCYILYDEETREAAVFDPAYSFEKIRTGINESGLRVKYIIITHAHFDHICALDELKEYTQASVCIGENDCTALSSDILNLSSAFGGSSPKTVPDIILSDGDELKLGNHVLTIISTPGHTPGGICIYCENILIAGDTLFCESIGRSDFPGGNSETLINSIKSKLFRLNNDTVVYPGHGIKTTIGHEKTNNPFIWW